MFGGLVYKTKKAHYGLNMERCDKFFKGEYKIPAFVQKNPITRQVTQGPDITINKIKNLSELLNADGEYQTKYLANKFKEVAVRGPTGEVEKIIRIPIN